MGRKINNARNAIQGLATHATLATWLTVAISLLIVLAGIVGLLWLGRDNHLALSTDDKINLTPTQVKSIENIGEWEFLAISDEELADTLHRGFFGDKELARIYQGTLRLGINLHKAQPGWITLDKDTLVATLPPIELLDNDFIDEGKTQPFYESGSWSQADRKALYEKAYRAMRQRGMSQENIEAAERNALLQFDNLLRSMGFENTRITFAKPKGK